MQHSDSEVPPTNKQSKQQTETNNKTSPTMMNPSSKQNTDQSTPKPKGLPKPKTEWLSPGNASDVIVVHMGRFTSTWLRTELENKELNKMITRAILNDSNGNEMIVITPCNNTTKPSITKRILMELGLNPDDKAHQSGSKLNTLERLNRMAMNDWKIKQTQNKNFGPRAPNSLIKLKATPKADIIIMTKSTGNQLLPQRLIDMPTSNTMARTASAVIAFLDQRMFGYKSEQIKELETAMQAYIYGTTSALPWSEILDSIAIHVATTLTTTEWDVDSKDGQTYQTTSNTHF